MTQEKGEDCKNPGFVLDYKTLADVLTQETIRQDLVAAFPELPGEMVHGEENGSFKDPQGKTWDLSKKLDQEETTQVLAYVRELIKI